MERWQEEIRIREDRKSLREQGPEEEYRPLEKGDGPHPWRQKIVLGAVVVALAFLVLRVAPIPFGVVKVDGDAGISAWDLAQTGLIPDPVNIVQISKKDLTKSLEQDLRVASVRMNYALPLTLEMHLVARKAVVAVMTDYGYGELDASGQCIHVDSAVGSKSLPMLTGYKMGNLLLGDQVEAKHVLAALSYIEHLTPEGRARISEVNIGEVSKFVAYTVDGIALRLEVDDKMADKAKLTESMLKDIKEKNLNVESIDVNLESPFMKIRK